MLLFQQGDGDCFRILYERYQKPIYSFLLRQCGNKEVAADLAQDVFTKMIHRATSFQHQSKFTTWIYTIARNTAVDNARKARHRKHASLETSKTVDGPAIGDKVESGDPKPDRAVVSKRLQTDLAKAIERLPADQREVFILREYQGLPFKEIAVIVDAKIGTVKSRMRYALETLQNDLETYEEYARTLP